MIFLNIHLQSHEMCSSNNDDSFIPYIIFNTFNFSSSVLFGTSNLSGRSSTAFAFTAPLYKLTINELQYSPSGFKHTCVNLAKH